MAQQRTDQVVERVAALLPGLAGLRLHVIEQFTQVAALKQVILERDEDDPALRMVDAVLAARYRDCVEQHVGTAADAVLAYVESPAAGLTLEAS